MAKRKGKGGDNAPPIVVIKRIEEAGHAHHGGAWKIAYADFVTAMMAFFLLMWLVNATTEAQRTGIADYFAPTAAITRGSSGAGQIFGGRTLNSEGTQIADSPLSPLVRRGLVAHQIEDDEGDVRIGTRADHDPENRPLPAIDPVHAAATAAEPVRAGEDQRRAQLAAAAEEIRQAVRNDPNLAELGRQLLIEEVPEGLRIQVVDAEGQPVFATGQAAPNDRGRALLLRAAHVVARLPHAVEVTGHTDAAPFRGNAGRTNWDLSAERANAARRLLTEAGIAEPRIRAVAGRADREPLAGASPHEAANRRVAVLVLLPPLQNGAPPR